MTAREYILKPLHTHKFLSRTILPISQVFSYAEMTAYLNLTIIERLRGALDAGKANTAKIFPLADDFDKVYNLARTRTKVFESFPLHKDRLCVIRDSRFERERREEEANDAKVKNGSGKVEGNVYY
ncbi:hypothetical protein B0H63DRAFT_158783 [Podospora didyma]|uniref:Uncharacterized protein n=1 Tax=Podospora didyma TaxID=330526 RepID=A0AAE0U1L5_9PEZI|nr:hypothetical protein B0H63DRAFT_158783 [Podospora didyma]